MVHQEALQEADDRLPIVAMSNGEEPLEDRVTDLSLEELLYSSASFHAISIPVSLTLILTALCVVYINTEQTMAQGEAALSSTYEAFNNNTDSNAQTLGISLLNALIIVSVICAMTFVIVLLYKYHCINCLIGYMMLSSTMLLGFLGGNMFKVAIDKYQLAIDKFSFYFTMYNFAIVGVASIFWKKGIPVWIEQFYLISTSVILAWQLSHFDPWTSWTLLVMLALYDLCAVLTPCGPLKALVNLMHQEGSPDMPGLLYEAQLPSEARRPRARRRRGPRNDTMHTAGTVVSEEPSPASTDEPVQIASNRSREEGDQGNEFGTTAATTPAAETPQTEEGQRRRPPAPRATIPLAIAKLYRLQIVENVEPLRPSLTPLLGEDGTPDESDNVAPHEAMSPQYTPEQLKSEVTAIFPRGGGRIEKGRNAAGAIRYAVRDRNDNITRILCIDDEGRVLEERHRNEGDEDEPPRNSIKLGLGDFIFYSVLVANAILYSFTTFAACFLVILAGLGGTLVLLAVYKQALPALPISIFLGVIFYLLTRELIEPWIQVIFDQPYYV